MCIMLNKILSSGLLMALDTLTLVKIECFNIDPKCFISPSH